MDDLKERVRQYNLMQLPGQPMVMHMGTAYLIQDLARHLATAEKLLRKAAGCLLDAHMEKRLRLDIAECLKRSE